MKYVQLRAFHNVAQHGGFSRAAAALGLSQPAVSDQVLSLEQAYDVLLFDRHKRQVSLTAAGRKLFEITRPMFEQESRALELLTENRAQARGHLRIIADAAFHVTALLSRFRARYPKVRITLGSGNTQEVEAALEAYEADIGVLGSRIETSRFQAVPLGATEIIAFCARSFAGRPAGGASLRDLARLPLVMRERGSRTRAKLEAAAKAKDVQLNPAIEAEGREAVREIVAAGAGIGFVSRAEYGRDERLLPIPILGETLTMDETVICLKSRADLRMIRAFMAMAKDHAEGR